MIVLLVLVALGVALLFVNRTVLRTLWDADAEVNTVEQYVTERVGEVPAWDPASNLEHALVSRELQRQEVEAYQERLVCVEDELTLHESPFSLTLKRGGCFVAEVLGCTLLFKGLGFSGIERIVLALLFASFLFWITSEANRQGGSAGKRSPWFALTLIAYALVMLAVTVLRAVQASTDGSSWAEDVSVGVVSLATTMGAAWLAEGIKSRSGPSIRLWKQRRNLLRRFRRAERRLRAAEAFTVLFARKRERISRKRTATAAAYNAAHFRATAQKEHRSADRFSGGLGLGGTP